jgi:CrcB protein
MYSGTWTATNFAAIGAGAAVGAWARWGLSVWLNPGPDRFPIGTWTANLVGCYLIGLALAYSIAAPDWSTPVRLFVVTGLLGGLTTYSTFSAETITFMAQGRIGLGVTYAAVSLVGCLTMTALGLWTLQTLRGG